MRPVPSDLPFLLTLTFYGLVAWGLSATFAAFRVLADNEVRRGLVLRACVVVWLGVPAYLAVTGALFDFSGVPPKLMLLIFPLLFTTVLLCVSPWGAVAAKRLPASLLVGTQVFRLPLELVLFGLAQRELLSSEMTFSGYNFDILTGILALPLWWRLRKQTASWRALLAWNILGLVLLITVVGIAIVSFPSPFGWFEPPNTIVAFYPWVWLPTFLVPIALASHLLMFRKLLFSADEDAEPSQVATASLDAEPRPRG